MSDDQPSPRRLLSTDISRLTTETTNIVARTIFVLSAAVILICASFAFGLYTGAKRTSLFDYVYQLWLVWEERSDLIGSRPTHWTEPRRFFGDGVIVNKLSGPEEDFVLLQGFFDGELEVRLIRRNGKILQRWILRGSELMRDISHVGNVPSTDWHYDTHGVVALPDGSIVFNLDQIGLFKLDKCGKVLWRVERPTHHSVEVNPDGTFWVSATRKWNESDSPPHLLFRPPLAEDVLMKVSVDGEILQEISLVDAFFASNELGLLTLTGGSAPSTMVSTRYDFDREIFHLNDVEELPEDLADDFPNFEGGDLLVSLRNRNVLLVLDRETNLIKWWHIGSWVRQHDPDWEAGGVISLFDNRRDGTRNGEILGSSRIVEIAPESHKVRTLYGDGEKEFFHSARRGKHQILGDGRLVITDAEAGRVIEVDSNKEITWEYVNGFNESYSARISEARVYDSNYFIVQDWSCTDD